VIPLTAGVLFIASNITGTAMARRDQHDQRRPQAFILSVRVRSFRAVEILTLLAGRCALRGVKEIPQAGSLLGSESAIA
jgi:hypothetical protein